VCRTVSGPEYDALSANNLPRRSPSIAPANSDFTVLNGGLYPFADGEVSQLQSATGTEGGDSFALPLGLTHVETWASPRARPCREIQESSPAVANFLSVELPP